MHVICLSTMGTHFGEDITVDGYDGDPKRLNDKELVASSLIEFPKKLSRGARELIEKLRSEGL